MKIIGKYLQTISDKGAQVHVFETNGKRMGIKGDDQLNRLMACLSEGRMVKLNYFGNSYTIVLA